MDTCRTCGKFGSLTCSSCKQTKYCSRDCQRADWRRHKRVDCTGITAYDPTTLLPPGFSPDAYLHCMHCNKHFMLCKCQGNPPGQGLMYVMHPIPKHFTVRQRIQRWGRLVSLHPHLGHFNAEQFVKDLPASFEQDLIETKPVIQGIMEKYKQSNDLRDLCTQVGINTEHGDELVRTQSCNVAIDCFFIGNWGYPTLLEFTFLLSAIQQMSSPEDYDAIMRARIFRIIKALTAIVSMFTLNDIKKCEYRVEDLLNTTGTPSWPGSSDLSKAMSET